MGSVGSVQPVVGAPAERGGEWVVHTSGTESDLLDIAADDRIMVAVGAAGTILTSVDGAAWVKRDAGVGFDLEQILAGNGRFVVLATEQYRPRAILSSADGIQWAVTALQGDLTDERLRFVAGQFILNMVDQTGLVRKPVALASADGKEWLPAPAGPPDSPEIAGQEGDALVGWVGEQIYRSRDDGRSWTKGERARLPGHTGSLFSPWLSRLVCGNGHFAAWFYLRAPGGSQSWLGASADGRVWHPTWTGSAENMSLAFGSNQFVVVADRGRTMASRTGEAWVEQASGVKANLKKVIYTRGQFVAIGAQGTIISRTDSGPDLLAETQGYMHATEKREDRTGPTVKLTLEAYQADHSPAPDGTTVTVAAYQEPDPLAMARDPEPPANARRGTGTTYGGLVTIDLGEKAETDYLIVEEPGLTISIGENWFSPLGITEPLPTTLQAGPSVLPAVPIQQVDESRPGATLQIGDSLDGIELTLLLQGSAWFVNEEGRPIGKERRLRIANGQIPGVPIVAEPGSLNLSLWDADGRMVGGFATLTRPDAWGQTGFICEGPEGSCKGGSLVVDTPCAPFADVMWTDAACAALQQMAGRRVTTGYADGTFRPTQPVTRAEFAKMLILTLQRKPQPGGALSFTDTAGHWAARDGYLQAAVAGGMIQGFADGTFRPDSSVSRAEAVKMVVAAATRLTPGDRQPYWDIAATDWYADAVSAAYEGRLIGRWAYPAEVWANNGFDGFEGNRPATRAEAISLLANLWAEIK